MILPILGNLVNIYSYWYIISNPNGYLVNIPSGKLT